MPRVFIIETPLHNIAKQNLDEKGNLHVREYHAIKCNLIVLKLKVILIFFYHLVCEALGTAATPGLLCQPWVIMKILVLV
jgi:hypothetical protein